MDFNPYNERFDWAPFSDGKAKLSDMVPSTKLDLHSTFSDPMEDNFEYLSEFRLFYAFFKTLPSLIEVEDVKVDALVNRIETDLQDRITSRFQRQVLDGAGRKLKLTNVIYIVDDRILLQVEKGEFRILYKSGDMALARGFMERFRRCYKRRNVKETISMLIHRDDRISTKPIKLPKPKLTLSTHYNDDLPPVHERMVRELRAKEGGGLWLLSGEPGMGKSTYINHLIHTLDKEVVFVTPTMAAAMEGTLMSRFLIDHPNTVFVIEDGEELLKSRDNGSNNGIAMLLNLTDGLLGKALSIHVIATFNTELRKIDKALLRKGRLRLHYRFEPLAPEKSAALLASLGHPVPEEPVAMSLADIYNREDNGLPFQEGSKKIGFRS